MSDIVERAQGCPVMNFDYAKIRPCGSYRQKAMELRDDGRPIWVNTFAQGFWVVTTQELVREVYLKADIFTTDSVMAVEPETNPRHILLPLNVNPPHHRKYRNLLAPWFSQAKVKELEPLLRASARDLVEGFLPAGKVDAAWDFCALLPINSLLGAANMPMSVAPQLMQAINDFTRGFSGLEATETGGTAGMDAAVEAIHAVTDEMIAERRARPLDPKGDFYTYLTTELIEGRLLTDDEIRQIGLIYVVAGMETIRAQLGWLLYHMAKVPEDRRRVLADPSLIPAAVEESIRYYTVIWGVGRKIGQDVHWHGVDLKKGDMIYALNDAFNRDQKRFEDPDRFDLNRKMAPHLSFGFGAHSCIGMHLARTQLEVALEEFHRLIPDYAIEDSAVIEERGSEVTIQSLPLVWNAGA
ncbi:MULTISPECIES: cytochrome P450 [Rhizobium]|uniref:cytochrome P450 n=1 Tax=Rhizobium phaseoli TaxID=396 RepID=UPI000A1C0ADC|nr:cytochrome P450 [Rhizobium phaseoli]ARM16134.1 cytochrome P450 protein [Rhizobium phaseoli Brasil 5]